MDEKIFEALHERVKGEPYAKMLGLELVKVASGYALIRMAFTERHHNIHGRCHGGAIFSLISLSFKKIPLHPPLQKGERGGFSQYPIPETLDPIPLKGTGIRPPHPCPLPRRGEGAYKE